MRRENETFLTYKNLRENRERLAKKELDRINESKKQKDNFMDNYYSIKESRIMRENERSILLEAARNDALATAIKAIYITALEAETMTDNGILLAENMVDNWINERGGASNILTPTIANSTYLLSRITQIVEDAAKEEVENIESNEDADDNGSKDLEISKLSAKEAEIKAQIAKLRAEKKAEEEGVSIDDNEEVEDTDATVDTDDKADGVEVSDMDMDEGNEDKVDTENGVKDKDGKEKTSPDEKEVEDTDTKEESSEEDTKEEESSDTEEKEESSEEDKKKEDTKEEEDDIELADTEVDIEEDEEDTKEEESSDTEEEDDDSDDDEDEDDDEEDDDSEEDDEEDEEDEDEEEDVVIDDEESEDDSIKDSNDKILDALDKEDDIHKAIDTIRDRVAKAEERFIKNNAEDKKKIEELLQKIENSTNTANSLKGKDDAKAEVAKESAFLGKRKADEIRNKVNNNKITIFEKMTNILTQNIVKDDAIRESYYTTDEGRLDVDLAVESAKVMYGFLETLNTIKLEKVNEAYIENVLNTMKNN